MILFIVISLLCRIRGGFIGTAWLKNFASLLIFIAESQPIPL